MACIQTSPRPAGWRPLFTLLMLILLWTIPAHAQTADYHFGFGMKLDQSKPPETVDMSDLKEKYGPAPGKLIQVFFLVGEVGRSGPWLSKYLPAKTRIGKPDILMFEDDRWQPLKPVGIRHGLEIPFAHEIKQLMPGETVGVVVVPESGQALLNAAFKAALADRCQFWAVVQNGDEVAFNEAVLKALLATPGLAVIDMPEQYRVPKNDSEALQTINDKGRAMARHVFDKINQAKE